MSVLGRIDQRGVRLSRNARTPSRASGCVPVHQKARASRSSARARSVSLCMPQRSHFVIATDTGVRTLPPIFARAARTMGSGALHRWVHVILPASLPYLISGMKQGWAFAWRSLMAAEIYVTILTGFGLGHLLHYGRELNAMDQVIGIMLVIVVIGLLTDKILFAPWERFLHRRWGTGRV